MGIYKRGSVWWIDYYDQKNQRVQESSHGSSQRAAQDLLAVRQSEVTRGIFKRPVKIAFAEFAKKYMEYAKTNKRSWLRDEQMLKQLHVVSQRARVLRLRRTDSPLAFSVAAVLPSSYSE